MTRLSLRLAVVFVAGLAGLKVWAQDRYQRGIFHETLIAAYGDQARLRCQKELGKGSKLTVRSDDMEVRIGSPHASVPIWDFDNPLWDVRYRHPHIVLSTGTLGPNCAYDVVAGLASFQNLGE